MHHEDEFRASPRGSLRTVCDGDGVCVVEIGPATDEAIINVVIDEAGILRNIFVTPTDGGKEGQDSEGGRSHLSVSSLVTPRITEDVDGDGPGQTPPISEIEVEACVIYPAKHHVVGSDEMYEVLAAITAEMEERCSQLGGEGRVLEAERLRQRTENDLLLLDSVGTCKVWTCDLAGELYDSMS